MTVRYLIPFFLFYLVACGASEADTAQSSKEETAPAQARMEKTSAKQTRPAENPDIRVQVAGFSSGSASLIGTFADQRYLADSATIQPDGSFVLQKDEPYRQGFYILLLPENVNIQMLISADQTFSMKTDKMMPIMKMEVEGSLDNELLYKTLQFEENQRAPFNKISTQMKSLAKESPEYKKLASEQQALSDARAAFLEDIFTTYPNTFFTTFKKAGQNPEIKKFYNPDGTLNETKQVITYRSEFWDNVDFSDERLLHTPVIINKLNRYMKKLTVQAPDSVIQSAKSLVDRVLDYPEYFKFFANWIALEYEPTKSKMMDQEAVYVFMVQNYFTYDRAFWADSAQTYGLQRRAYEMAASLIGKKGPDVTIKDINGVQRSIYEIKDPYVIVYLYNPKCEHCQKETPQLVQLHREWKPKGLEVFAIAIDTEEEEWREYVGKNDMQRLINVFDPTNASIYAKYYVNITPELYVLNPDRTIIGKNLKVHQVETIINRDKEESG